LRQIKKYRNQIKTKTMTHDVVETRGIATFTTASHYHCHVA